MQVSNTTSCTLNFQRPECPAGSPMVDATDPAATVCKQTNALCQAQEVCTAAFFFNIFFRRQHL